MAGALHLLVTSIDYIRPDFRKKAIFRHAADRAIPDFLRSWYRQRLEASRSWNSVAGLLLSEREEAPRKSPSEDQLLSLDSASSRTPESILNSLIADAVTQATRQDLAGFKQALATATEFHRFLLLSFVDRTHPLVSPLLKRMGFGRLHEDWIRGYRAAHEATTRLLALTPDFARAIAGVPTDIIGRAYEVELPGAALSYLLRLHEMQLYRLTAWIRSRAFHPDGDTIGLLPSDRSAYVGAIGDIIADRGYFRFMMTQRHDWPRNHPAPDDEIADVLPGLADRLSDVESQQGGRDRALERDLEKAGIDLACLRQVLAIEAASAAGTPDAEPSEDDADAEEADPELRGRRLLGHYRSAKAWQSYRSSWPALIDELSGELTLLGISVRDGDDVGAPMLCDMILQWTRRWDYTIRAAHWRLATEQALDLAIVTCGWPETRRRLGLAFHNRTLEAGSVFGRFLELAWQDALMVLTGVLLHWSVRPRDRDNALAARTVQALAHRVLHDQRYGHDGEHATPLQGLELIEARMRLWFATWRRTKYWEGWLDRFARIDGMTEPPAVPGEPYRPTKISDVRELDTAFLAMLLADRFRTGRVIVGELEWLRTFIRRLLAQAPDHHGAALSMQTNIKDEIKLLEDETRQRAAGEVAPNWLTRMLGVLLPDAEMALSTETELQVLREFVDELQAVRRCLTEERRRFADGLPLDPAAVTSFGVRLDRIVREHIATWLYPFEPQLAFGEPETDAPGARVSAAPPGLFRREILTDPVLADPPSDHDLKMRLDWSVGHAAWKELLAIDRDVRTIEGDDRSPVFWGTVTTLAASAGVDPILLVPSGQATALQGWVYRMSEEEKARYGFSGNRRELGEQALFRCGTVTVIRSGVPTPLLVSNRKIQRLRLLSTGTGSRFIEVAFRHRLNEPEEVEAGLPTTEGVTFDCRLEIDWSEGPVYEFRFATPGDGGGGIPPALGPSSGKARKRPSRKPEPGTSRRKTARKSAKPQFPS